MRRLAAFALLFLITGCATTQFPEAPDDLPSSEPFKNANVMYIQTNASPEAAREKMARTLVVQDYEIDESLSDEDTITILPRTFGSGVAGSARYRVNVMDDGRLKLTGKFIAAKASDRSGFEQHTPHTVAARGGRLSTSLSAWYAMQEIAEAYGETVLYSRENV